MTSEERDRAALIRAAAESWGEEVADTLSELLPPPGDRPATKRDMEGVLAAIDAMDERHEARFDGMDARLVGLDARLVGVESGLVGMDARLVGVESGLVGMDARLVGLDARLVGLDARLVGVESGLVGLDARLVGVESGLVGVESGLVGIESRFDRRLDERLDAVADRITASFERRIADAVTMQTRTLVFSQLSSIVVIAALAFGFR